MTPRPTRRVHIVGAGPVGLFLASLLQSIDGQQVRLYERRDAYTRTRMVSLASSLIADSIESYKEDAVDGQDVLDEWTRGFVPLKTIESSLSDLIDTRTTGTCGAR
jgi:2-polyprenyl-6-methoxyphenol hydroxylase-like FAD-dependent oxidoreductase